MDLSDESATNALHAPMLPAVRGIERDQTPGDHVRLVLRQEDGVLRPLFFITVHRRGDLYFGIDQGRGEVFTGTTEVEEGATSVSIRYEDAVPVQDPKHDSYWSLHASGQTNLSDARRRKLASLRDLDRQREVCGALFAHPARGCTIEARRKGDVAFDYRIDERRPLEGRLIVAPLDRWDPAGVPGAVDQLNIVLQYRGLEETPDLVVQFVFSTGVEGEWPPGSVLFVAGWINTHEARQGPLHPSRESWRG
jgi:hypothetical protein